MSYPFILCIVNWYNNDKLENYIYNSKAKKNDTNDIITGKSLHILIGFDENKNAIYLEEKALFQNILITGSIGTGKTSSRNV